MASKLGSWKITNGGTSHFFAILRRISLRIENSSTSRNICSPTYFSETEFPDEYALGQLMLTHSNIDRAGAMISASVIKNIQDISIYWRTTYTSKIYICYQLNGTGDWKELHSMSDSNIDDGVPIAGNYSGERGWDAHGYTTFNSSSWTTKELYGADAKLAFVIAGKVSGNLPLSAICINSNKAAVRYLNALSYRDHVCSENGENNYYNLYKGVSDNTHNQALFQLATEHADADFLAQYEVAGSKTSEVNALGLYNHLVTSIPSLGEVKASSARVNGGFGNSSDNSATIAIVVISAVSISTITLLLVLKKKKRV